MNPNIHTLLELGPDFEQDHDYLNWVTANDLDDLLDFVNDPQHVLEDNNLKAYWAPLHAVLAISQINDASCASRLMACIPHIQDVELAFEILPTVLAQFGGDAIAELEQHFNNAELDQFARLLAMDVLVNVMQNRPELEPKVMKILLTYADDPTKDAEVLNSLLITHLVELEADYAIDTIRTMFETCQIDLKANGDIEDVEISLGLRDERDTPSIFADDEFDDVDDSDFIADEILDNILLQYGSDASLSSSSELDGFFAALACSPQIIMPSTWMPAIWGGEEHAPEFERIETAEIFTHLVGELYNEVIQQFEDNDYAPLFGYIEDSELMVVDPWTYGFMYGRKLWSNMAQEQQNAVNKLLSPIAYFNSDDYDLSKPGGAKQALKQQEKILPNLKKLRRITLGENQHTVVRSTAKIGRNDPCSCGSGKKYKKCCGLN